MAAAWCCSSVDGSWQIGLDVCDDGELEFDVWCCRGSFMAALGPSGAVQHVADEIGDDGSASVVAGGRWVRFDGQARAGGGGMGAAVGSAAKALPS